MRTDPIKLVQNILSPKTTASDPKTKAAETTTSSTADTATVSAKANDSKVAKPTINGSEAYKLSQSLLKKLSLAETTSSTESADLSTYTAQGLKDHFQSVHESQTKAKAAAQATAKPLDEVLKSSQDNGTNAPKLSAAAQEIVKEKKATSTDTALAAVDSRLAQTVGVSRIIGTA